MREHNKHDDLNTLAIVDFRDRSYNWSCLVGFILCSSSRKATRCLRIFAHSMVPPPTTVSYILLSITSSRDGPCWYLYLLADLPADSDILESAYNLLVYSPCLAQRRYDMVGPWPLPAASLLLLQIALSLEAPAGGKRCIHSVFRPGNEGKPMP